MPRFYMDLSGIKDGTISLASDVVQHLNVLRYKEGDTITVFDGKGRSVIVKILALQKKGALTEIVADKYIENTHYPKLELGLSIIANDKMESAIRGATELGVTAITPLITEYTQRISPERLEKRVEHWRKIIISSAEQSERDFLPEINSPTAYAEFAKHNNCSNKFILSIHKVSNLTEKSAADNASTCLMVGPEGGFTLSEVDLAIQHGFNAIKPWPYILRSETAVVAGLSLLSEVVCKLNNKQH